MCKKLMFLISLVALLSLANGTYGGDDFVWDGEGAGNSACELANWDLNETAVDPTSQPTAGDECKTDCQTGDPGSYKAIHIDSGCNIVCKRWYAPTRSGDEDQTFNMTGGTLTVYDRMRAADGGTNRRATINISGDALINVVSDDDKAVRWCADNPAGPGLQAYVTIGDFAIMNVQPAVRAGAGDDFGGGHANLVFEGDSTFNVTEHLRPCDEGSAIMTARGNAEINVGTAPAWLYTSAGDWGVLAFNCKYGNGELHVQDNATIWCRNGIQLKNYSTGAVHSANLTMTGGTINTGDLLVATGLNSTSTANISGGLVVVRGTLRASDGTNVVQINLSGDAEVQVNILTLNNGAVMDIDDDAQLILEGNVLAAVFALRDAGKLTACGGGMSPLQAAYDGGTDKTTVWADCTIPACAAWDPQPLNTAAEVPQTIGLLEFRRGDGMGPTDFHYVFFSDDEACVTNAYCEELGATCYRAWERPDMLEVYDDHDISDLSLDLWTTYYWRVDEDAGTCCMGPVWSFTTGCTLVVADINMDCVVNGLDYALLASTWMEEDLWP